MSDSPRFFRTAAAFATWLAKNHSTARELVVGFYKKDSGKPSITYPEALDQALIFGWIDGVRRSVDADSYSIRFSPRNARSIWSNVNMKRFKELETEGRMRPEGRAVFERRDPERSGVYSYEREHATFSPDELRTFAAEKRAKAFFDAQAPYYKRVITFWVTSAKKPETRARRLATLIEYSKNGERVPLVGPKKNDA